MRIHQPSPVKFIQAQLPITGGGTVVGPSIQIPAGTQIIAANTNNNNNNNISTTNNNVTNNSNNNIISPNNINAMILNGGIDENSSHIERYCADCKIRFSSTKTYRAHKQHYCGNRHRDG